MGSLIVIFLLWCIFAVVFGSGVAYIEGRVNNQPPRWRNCILWTFFLGVFGILVVGIRSSLKYSSAHGESQKLQAEVARRQLAEMDARAAAARAAAQQVPQQEG